MATMRQKKAAKLVVENGGIISKAMEAAGYSPKTAKTPQKLTESDGWKELMKNYLPDKLLAKKHQELLEVPIKIKTKRAGLDTIEIEMLDTFAVSKGLDMAYKLKGLYSAERIEQTITTTLLPEQQAKLDKILNDK
jgi:transposase